MCIQSWIYVFKTLDFNKNKKIILKISFLCFLRLRVGIGIGWLDIKPYYLLNRPFILFCIFIGVLVDVRWFHFDWHPSSYQTTPFFVFLYSPTYIYIWKKCLLTNYWVVYLAYQLSINTYKSICIFWFLGGAPKKTEI